MDYRVVVHGVLAEDVANEIADTLRLGMPGSMRIEVLPDLDLPVGELGLPVDVAGTVAQALGAQAADRGNVSRDQVKAYLESEAYDEDELWTVLGPQVDVIEDGASSLLQVPS